MKLIKYLKPYWMLAVPFHLLMVGEVVVDLFQLKLMARIVDQGVLAGNIEIAVQTGIIMFVLVIIGGAFGTLCAYNASKAAQNFVHGLRRDSFDKVMSLSIQQTDKFTGGSLVTRLTNDIGMIQELVQMSLRMFIRAPIFFIGVSIMMLTLDVKFTTVALIGLPVLLLLIALFLKKATPMFSKVQTRLDRVNSVVQENVSGATGSGKTTVVNLLTRFYEIDVGGISIDGVDIRDIPKAELRRMIGIVLQDTVLFSDSIRTNIMYGNFDASEADMKRAADMANASEFIERLSEGYDTRLAEMGRNLSQGQRQLLSISSAILKDLKILILDEATSSVDTRTEMNIQSAMVALMKSRMSLIIAHRLSTIRDADTIVVIKGGRFVEAGNHEELLGVKGEYYKLYSSQFAGVAI